MREELGGLEFHEGVLCLLPNKGIITGPGPMFRYNTGTIPVEK